MIRTSLASHYEALLGVLEDPLQIGGIDVQCPVCGEHSPPSWSIYRAHTAGGTYASLPGASGSSYNDVAVDWMRCANEECEQLIVRVHEQMETGAIAGTTPVVRTDTWLARPRFGESERPIDSLVPEPFRSDYAEAAALLEISPRMSAVLSRSIMADLLKTYAGKEQYGLAARIDSFTEEAGHPTSLTSNLHHFREIADFGAHTQEDKEAAQPLIIPVERDEAEWTLDLVDRLFDYFIVQPAKDETIKGRMDEKIKRAGRKPLRETDGDES